MSIEAEQRLQLITEQLLLVRDNLWRGMSKSMQKLQARNINEILGLEAFVGSGGCAQSALDKIAENARDLGLDYEPKEMK